MSLPNKFLLGASAIALLAVDHSVAVAQDEKNVEEIAVIGSRSNKPRTSTDSPVPVDVFNSNQINGMGNVADMTDNLKALVPSYTATPATGDGSAFVRPTSLRGLAPDQTLVLVNGKRRHRSALLHFFAPAAGNGAHGPDVGMIPSVALKRVEVLRDGAAAQYGSDAIAGVINFVTKDSRDGGSVMAQYGQFYEGESSLKLAGNVGLGLGERGFVNLSVEHFDNDALSRGIQRPDAQQLIDDGVHGVGADSPFGDAPLVQTWGRPETSGTRTYVTAGYELNEDHSLYFNMNYAETDGRYRFFYRSPDHSSLAPLRDMGFTGLPAGFTPYLDGAQRDLSLVGGVKGTFGSDVDYDVSTYYGRNFLNYYLNNSVNPSLGLSGGQIPQMDFNVGALRQEELTLNADFSKQLNDNVNLAMGLEFREETYRIFSGETNSWFGAGVSGFKGYHPRDSGEFKRDNWAVYADVEQDVSDKLLMQYALRYENFSDFGGTLNGKIATRYRASDDWTLRAAVSTGFHAPTPGQSNVQAVITTFDSVSGGLVEEGLVRPGSAAAIGAGGAPLTEEKSKNFSLGATGKLDDVTITFDLYRIEIDDRIYRTINLPGAAPGQTVSFFTNSLDMYSQGIDFVITSTVEHTDNVSTDFSFAANYNKVKITGQKEINGNLPVSDATIEDIENNYPNIRATLSSYTTWDDTWSLMLRVNYYGGHYDERGEIGAATSPSYRIGSTTYLDVELGYHVTENFQIVAGASNIANGYVDEIGAPYANRLSVGLPYGRRSAANYEGGSWYLRASYSF